MGRPTNLPVPNYTVSIDAALTLVPEGWTRHVDATAPECGIDVDLFAPAKGSKAVTGRHEKRADCYLHSKPQGPRGGEEVKDQPPWQESLDWFYFRHGKCCAGCDWWSSISSLVGNCTQSKIIPGAERGDMLGINNCSLKLPSGHAVTKRDYVCGNFKDEFDWASLPLPYRKRVGAPL